MAVVWSRRSHFPFPTPKNLINVHCTALHPARPISPAHPPPFLSSFVLLTAHFFLPVFRPFLPFFRQDEAYWAQSLTRHAGTLGKKAAYLLSTGNLVSRSGLDLMQVHAGRRTGGRTGVVCGVVVCWVVVVRTCVWVCMCISLYIYMYICV